MYEREHKLLTNYVVTVNTTSVYVLVQHVST
jgi:hypothetical protein